MRGRAYVWGGRGDSGPSLPVGEPGYAFQAMKALDGKTEKDKQGILICGRILQ